MRRVDDAAAGPSRIVGQLDVRFAIDALALQGDDAELPDRRRSTSLVFFDAVDPNLFVAAPDPAAPERTFPITPTIAWTLTPRFAGLAEAAGAAQARTHTVTLPVATPPKQMPRIVSAGIALSPYAHDPAYAATEPRRRELWVELAEPVADPNDAYYARVLAYGPDPLLAGDVVHNLVPVPQVPNDPITTRDFARTRLPVPPDPPPLPLAPELVRVIVPNQPPDSAGLDKMHEMMPAATSDRHYLVPLPRNVGPGAAELFGFWTYEICVGHKRIWSTERDRYGRPLRVGGVQHPAPALRCSAYRRSAQPSDVVRRDRIVVSAPYATAVFADRKLTRTAAGDPRTRMWIMLYAQVTQADGAARRNLLLGRVLARPEIDANRVDAAGTRDVVGVAAFDRRAVEAALADLALPPDTPLSVLAVELLPGGGMRLDETRVTDTVTVWTNVDEPDATGGGALGDDAASSFAGVQSHRGRDPLGADLGGVWSQRILRTSPLTPVPPAC